MRAETRNCDPPKRSQVRTSFSPFIHSFTYILRTWMGHKYPFQHLESSEKKRDCRVTHYFGIFYYAVNTVRSLKLEKLCCQKYVPVCSMGFTYIPSINNTPCPYTFSPDFLHKARTCALTTPPLQLKFSGV